MSNFTVEAFKSVEGVEDPSKFVVKLRRKTIHPGVMTKFIAEAIGSEDTSDKAFNYFRGLKNHQWTLTADELGKLKAHMSTFTAETLQARFKELRAEFPVVPPVASKDDLLAALQASVGGDEDEVEEKDE